jgi:hypothetical protein
MNTKNNASLLLGALLAFLPGCASPNSPDNVVDAFFPSPLPFGPPGAPLVLGPFAENVHNLVTRELGLDEKSYEEELRDALPEPGEDTPSLAWDHWNAESVTPRAGRFFFNYDSDRDGPSMLNKWREDRGDAMETLRRMIFHKNSDNPFQR